MSILKEIKAICKELTELNSKAEKVDKLQKEIDELHEKINHEEELWKFILPEICPEEIEKKTNGLINRCFNQKLANSANDFLKRPKVLGYTIICTYCDSCAELNEPNDSTYDIFLLLENGEIVHVCNIGSYWGNHRDFIPSAKELIIRNIFPEIKHFSKEASICLKKINEIELNSMKRKYQKI